MSSEVLTSLPSIDASDIVKGSMSSKVQLTGSLLGPALAENLAKMPIGSQEQRTMIHMARNVIVLSHLEGSNNGQRQKDESKRSIVNEAKRLIEIGYLKCLDYRQLLK